MFNKVQSIDQSTKKFPGKNVLQPEKYDDDDDDLYD